MIVRFDRLPVVFAADNNIPNINTVVCFVIHVVLAMGQRRFNIVVDIVNRRIKKGPEQNNTIVDEVQKNFQHNEQAALTHRIIDKFERNIFPGFIDLRIMVSFRVKFAKIDRL